jgi:hypothetical protein
MDLDMTKNLLRPHPFNYDTDSISEILDEFLFGLLQKFEYVGQPVVYEKFWCPVGWVHHLETNIGIGMKSLKAMVLILGVDKPLLMSQELCFLFAASFYAKNVLQSTRLVHRSNIFLI